MKNGWTLSEMKEFVLACLSLVWGIVFFLPGDILSEASRVDLLAVYAGDVTWGIFLVVCSTFLLITPRDRYFWIRRYVHVFFWIFWLGIYILIVVRSFSNGLSGSDILISTPFLAIAFIHAIFYIRLVNVR